MPKNTLLKHHEIGIFALGGLGEVGKNCYVLEYKDQLFIIDAGILFPDDSLFGIDYVIPDFQYLLENQEKIVGLFITHGHEDHIGGIPFLLKKVKIPKIYASGFAVDLIENKLLEHKDAPAVTIVEYKSHYTYAFNDIELSFFRTNHSIPDSFGFIFKTPHGNIVHTGDFKVDFTPVGPPAEFDKLAKAGSEGVLALLSDSTNSEHEGYSRSESIVGTSIRELFNKIEGRIIIATFASNVYRMQQIVEASVLSKRKIGVFGRSMERAIEIGQQAGYIKAPKGTFITANEINHYKKHEITLLCTGSQGEPMAALSRIANGSHRQIKTIPGDTVIFSSSPIPGNAESVNRTINQLFKNGVDVITHSPLTDTHTSGHAEQGELKLILSLTKPKYFIPIHGEHRMLKIHAQLGVSTGVKKENTFVIDNGDIVALTKDYAHVAGKVHSGDVYIDGTGIGDIGSMVIKERKLLSEDGLVSVILTVNTKTKEIITSPNVVSRGFVYMKGNEVLTETLAKMAKQIASTELQKQKVYNSALVKTAITEAMNKYIYETIERKPMVVPILMEV